MSEKPEENIRRKRKRFRDRSLGARFAIAFAWLTGGLLVLALLCVCAVTWLLTPERLSLLISREASEELKADVTVKNARFTIWSTFPHFCVKTDSIIIVSRTLRGISPAERRMLPAGCDSLASAAGMKGDVNILGLLRRRLYLRNVVIDGLRLNFAALNDSVDNFSIFPQTDDKRAIPYFTANYVKIINPHSISYTSAATDAHINFQLSDAAAYRLGRDHDSYDLVFQGRISAKVKKLRVLDNFPFRFEGMTHLRFDPFNVAFNDYGVKLGNTSGKLNMDLDLGEEMKVNNFTYRVDAFNLMRLLEYFPGNPLPYLSRINADITIDADARLTNPYRFSATTLPSVEVDFHIPDGDISYTVNENETYSMRHKGMRASLFFNGEDPDSTYLSVFPFTLSGDGMNLTVSGRVDGLTDDDPATSLHIDAESDLSTTGATIRALRRFSPAGKLTAGVDVAFRVSNLKDIDLDDIRIAADVTLDDFYFNDKADDISASCNSLSLNVRSTVDAITGDRINNENLSLSLSGSDLVFKAFGMDMKARELAVKTNLAENISFSVSSISSLYSPGGRPYGFLADVSVSEFGAGADGNSVSLSGLDAKIDVRKRNRDSVRPQPQPVPDIWLADSAMLKDVRHSGLFLSASMPAQLKNLLDVWDAKADVTVKQGSLSSPGFSGPVRFRDVCLTADRDSVSLRNISVRSRESALRASGKVTNLDRFLNSKSPVPIDLSLNLDIDTLSINQLSKSYLDAAARAAGKKLSSTDDGKIPAIDSIAFLIPRNLRADIRATADMTRYMNLRLYDLSTRLHIADGNADIDSLRISADFGHAFLNASYRTADVEKLKVAADLGILDVDVVGFFRNFHSLLLMMPQMKNLSGTVSARCKGDMLVFPNMAVNVPSLFADIHVTGNQLKVHQNQFIRRITKMMLLPDSRDIHIKNMVVHASVHDNLLELYPFNFEFEKYHLSMGGVNNFDGKLYYHIGVEKSPVPFPFGINIVNYFHDPKLRFGGAVYKIAKGEEITASVMEKNDFNLVKEVKYYMREFFEKAAESAPSEGE